VAIVLLLSSRWPSGFFFLIRKDDLPAL